MSSAFESLSKFLSRVKWSFWAIPLMVVLISLLHSFKLVDFHENDALDLRFRLRGEQKAHSDIVIVTIDDPSLDALGQWPWPRGVYGKLLNLLSFYQPRAVFFDILFTEASPDPKQDAD